MVGAVYLGTDVAVLYFNWVQLQKAADAAAVAGANWLPGNPFEASTTDNQYAENNGIKAAEITSGTVAINQITISLERNVPYNFTILGLTSTNVTATATAGAPICANHCERPVRQLKFPRTETIMRHRRPGGPWRAFCQPAGVFRPGDADLFSAATRQSSAGSAARRPPRFLIQPREPLLQSWSANTCRPAASTRCHRYHRRCQRARGAGLPDGTPYLRLFPRFPAGSVK